METSKRQYSIGIDFGTLSARGILYNAEDGTALFSSTYLYDHAVMSDCLPDGTVLPPDYALQDPNDYLMATESVLTDIAVHSGADMAAVKGIGIDFTSCTVLPVTKDGVPLCTLPGFESEKHAYVKLWKHHSAQKYAKEINDAVALNNWTWLQHCSGKVSAEWMLPKLLEIYRECPAVRQKMGFFLEAGDWITWRLTGRLTRNSAAAGFVGTYNCETGYPPLSDLDAIQKGFGDFAYEKAFGDVFAPGAVAGLLRQDVAEKVHLPQGIPVAVSHMDSQAGMLALKDYHAGTTLAIIGTSTVFLVLSDCMLSIPGVSSVVRDGIVPGYYGYSAGQSCVGDIFEWASNVCLPENYAKEAREKNISVQELLTRKASRLKPGESGLIALDWHNGNRSVLLDMDLSGLIMGLTLQTSPEEIYRAMIEATAFGARTIIERFREYGIDIPELHVTGGIPQKNKLLLQIYADVLNLPVLIANSQNGPARGAAVLGAVAGGIYSTVSEASKHLGCDSIGPIMPAPENVNVYNSLYQEYKKLHDYFGIEDLVMHRLKTLRSSIWTERSNLPL